MFVPQDVRHNHTVTRPVFCNGEKTKVYKTPDGQEGGLYYCQCHGGDLVQLPNHNLLEVVRLHSRLRNVEAEKAKTQLQMLHTKVAVVHREAAKLQRQMANAQDKFQPRNQGPRGHAGARADSCSNCHCSLSQKCRFS